MARRKRVEDVSGQVPYTGPADVTTAAPSSFTPSTGSYQVQPADRDMLTIAQKLNIPYANLRAANPGKISVGTGEFINLPKMKPLRSEAAIAGSAKSESIQDILNFFRGLGPPQVPTYALSNPRGRPLPTKAPELAGTPTYALSNPRGRPLPGFADTAGLYTPGRGGIPTAQRAQAQNLAIQKTRQAAADILDQLLSTAGYVDPRQIIQKGAVIPLDMWNASGGTPELAAQYGLTYQNGNLVATGVSAESSTGRGAWEITMNPRTGVKKARLKSRRREIVAPSPIAPEEPGAPSTVLQQRISGG